MVLHELLKHLSETFSELFMLEFFAGSRQTTALQWSLARARHWRDVFTYSLVCLAQGQSLDLKAWALDAAGAAFEAVPDADPMHWNLACTGMNGLPGLPDVKTGFESLRQTWAPACEDLSRWRTQVEVLRQSIETMLDLPQAVVYAVQRVEHYLETCRLLLAGFDECCLTLSALLEELTDELNEGRLVSTGTIGAAASVQNVDLRTD
jgi:hypothetical protein